MIDLGWTWDEVLDQLDLERVNDLDAQWLIWPPIRVSVGIAIQYKPPEPKQYMTAEAAMELTKRTGGNLFAGPTSLNRPGAP